jgi:hypothetical protein
MASSASWSFHHVTQNQVAALEIVSPRRWHSRNFWWNGLARFPSIETKKPRPRVGPGLLMSEFDDVYQ